MTTTNEQSNEYSYSAAAIEAMRVAARMMKYCCAKTRTGAPCDREKLPGRERCANHGGLSTGPKTREGRKAIAESNHDRRRHDHLEERKEIEKAMFDELDPDELEEMVFVEITHVEPQMLDAFD